VITVVVSMFKMLQPKSWLAGLGQKRRCSSKGGEGRTAALKT
jgi:hypothetical protein